MNRFLVWSLAALAISMAAFVACSSNPATNAATSTGAGAGGSGAGGHHVHDAGADGGGGSAPVRTLTTRALWPTPIQNLLIDPFMTDDLSWGHFIGVVPPATPDGDYNAVSIVREFYSASPLGASAPVALLSPPAPNLVTLAPFIGGDSVTAAVWIAVGDSSGSPKAFPQDLDTHVTVKIVPNYLPSEAPLPAYALEVDPSKELTIGGRTWGRLTLSAVAAPEGGWFSIVVLDANETFLVGAPEVVPAQAGATPTPPGARRPPRPTESTDLDRAAAAAYARIAARPRPRLRGPAKHAR